MEGFTVVLMVGWLLLLGAFVGMYFLDQATKRVADRRTTAAPPAEKSR